MKSRLEKNARQEEEGSMGSFAASFRAVKVAMKVFRAPHACSRSDQIVDILHILIDIMGHTQTR